MGIIIEKIGDFRPIVLGWISNRLGFVQQYREPGTFASPGCPSCSARSASPSISCWLLCVPCHNISRTKATTHHHVCGQRLSPGTLEVSRPTRPAEIHA